MIGPTTPLARVLALLDERPATLGAGRLLCIDGAAGSGKTTLATAVAGARPDARTVHMDDLYEGWSGLGRADERLDDLLRPLAAGAAGHYRRYDWESGHFAETHELVPGPLLVLEGVGSGTPRFDDVRTVLVWVGAPHDVRMRRGLERDGDLFEPHWVQWARDEAVLFERHQTLERADLVLDGLEPYGSS